jgi:hypothetical protein
VKPPDGTMMMMMMMMMMITPTDLGWGAFIKLVSY